MNLKQRSLLLLKNTRFLTLATQDADLLPWASTVEFRIKFNPLRFVWLSAHSAKHSQNIYRNDYASGTVFNHSLPEMKKLDLDGMQFTGRVREMAQEENVDALNLFYPSAPFDDIPITSPTISLDDIQGDGHSRFYELTVEKLWLLNIEQWLETQKSDRVSVPLSLLF